MKLTAKNDHQILIDFEDADLDLLRNVILKLRNDVVPDVPSLIDMVLNTVLNSCMARCK